MYKSVCHHLNWVMKHLVAEMRDDVWNWPTVFLHRNQPSFLTRRRKMGPLPHCFHQLDWSWRWPAADRCGDYNWGWTGPEMNLNSESLWTLLLVFVFRPPFFTSKYLVLHALVDFIFKGFLFASCPARCCRPGQRRLAALLPISAFTAVSSSGMWLVESQNLLHCESRTPH